MPGKRGKIVSERQRGFFGAELRRRKEGKKPRMKGITTEELKADLESAGGKDLPARAQKAIDGLRDVLMKSSARAGRALEKAGLVPDHEGTARLHAALTTTHRDTLPPPIHPLVVLTKGGKGSRSGGHKYIAKYQAAGKTRYKYPPTGAPRPNHAPSTKGPTQSAPRDRVSAQRLGGEDGKKPDAPGKQTVHGQPSERTVAKWRQDNRVVSLVQTIGQKGYRLVGAIRKQIKYAAREDDAVVQAESMVRSELPDAKRVI